MALKVWLILLNSQGYNKTYNLVFSDKQLA